MKPRRVPFSFTMPPDVFAQLAALAERERRSLAFMICEAVIFYLQHHAHKEFKQP